MQETEVQKRERHHQEDLQRLRGFRPIDDTFMRGLFSPWQNWCCGSSWENLI